MEEGTVDLKPYFQAIWSRRFFVVIVALTAALIGLGITFALPTAWRARTVLLLPTAPDASALSIPFMNQEADPLLILQGIVQSYPAQQYIAKNNGLTETQVSNDLNVTTDSGRQQLSISYETTDREFGLKVVRSAIKILDELGARTELDIASSQARVLEQAVKDKTREVEDIEAQIRKFQETTVTAPDPSSPFAGLAYVQRLRAVQMDLGTVKRQLTVAREEASRQAQKSVSVPTALASNQKWRDRLVQMEYDLRLKETQLGPEAPEVVATRRQIDVTRRQLAQEIAQEMTAVQQSLDPRLAELEARRLLLEWQEEYLVKMADIAPKESEALQRLLREASVRTEVLKQVRTQFEQERIKARVERIKWGVLAEPYIEPKPTNKQFVRNTLLGGFLGILIAALVVVRRYAVNGSV
jgi:uncharacterized protein involved in exopolysaccharide biosynthesis